MRPLLCATAVAAALTTASGSAGADCGDSTTVVWLTGGIALLAGATGALVATGVIVAADDTKDFSFGLGAGVGVGVTAGLSALYVGVDLASGCPMAREEATIVWSVPIVTGLLGTVLPIAVWGASDDVEPAEEEPPPAAPAGVVIRF
jgi:hypothetical protein